MVTPLLASGLDQHQFLADIGVEIITIDACITGLMRRRAFSIERVVAGRTRNGRGFRNAACPSCAAVKPESNSSYQSIEPRNLA